MRDAGLMVMWIAIALFPLMTAVVLIWPGIATLALLGTYIAGISLLGDLLGRSREDWKKAVTTRDGRIILVLGAVTFVLTIAMMVGAYLQLI